MVVRRCSPGSRSSSRPSTSGSHIVHRRIGHQLECFPRLRTSLGLVVSELLSLFARPPRASSDLPGSGWFQSAPSSAIRGSVHGQHHRFVVPSERGRDSFVYPQFRSSGDSPVLRGQFHPPPAAVHSGENKCPSRHSQPELSGPWFRVDPLPGCVSGALSPVVCHDRPLCHFSQQQAPSVFFSDSGSAGGGSRHDVTRSGLHVPSLWSHSSPSCQGSAVSGSGADTRGSLLASETLVSRHAGIVGGSSSSSADPSGSAPSAPCPSLPSQPPRSSVDWLSHCE